MYREGPAPRAPITISYRVFAGEKVFVTLAVLVLIPGFIVASVVVGRQPGLGPLVGIALFVSPFVWSVVSELRSVAVTIDHARGVVSFKPSYLSRRQEIELARVLDVEIENAVSITRHKGGSLSTPTPVGRICLVLEDDKVPIEKRMRPEMDAHRAALAKIKEALQATRPSDDARA
jgi:hypothetical protein